VSAVFEDAGLRPMQAALADNTVCPGAAAALERLIRMGFDRVPMPGSGATLQRWRMLAAVASHDLAVAKLYEGHTDALAILHELGASALARPGRSWGVWAAEAPDGRAVIESVQGRDAILEGGKCWCSGAVGADNALLTAWMPDGRGPQLVSVDLHQIGVCVDSSAWNAVGMAGSASVDVRFSQVRATLVGRPGEYLTRPGFWHGGAGVAACWYGGAVGIANALRRAVDEAPAAGRSASRMTALGKVDIALRRGAALLREAANWIDTHPLDDASALAIRVRLAVEETAEEVLHEVGRSLGAGPFCRDRRFAHAAADLPVFIRQSHGDRDCAALAERVITNGEPPWDL
jgi:hypothetical protein